MTQRVRRKDRWAGAVLALVLWLPGSAGQATAQQVHYDGSVGYSAGSFTFTERTESFSILNALSVATDRWSVSGSLPIVIQNSGDVTYVGGMQVPTGSGRGGMGGRGAMTPGSSTGGSAYEATLGDPVIRSSFTPYEGFGTLRVIGVQAMVKAPLADPVTGVGTGEWDVGGGVSTGFGVGPAFIFADATFWSPGDLPDLELRSYVTGAVGAGRPLGERWSGLASVSVSSPMIDGLSAPVSVSGGLSYRLGENRSLRVGAGWGLTDSAPDLSVYLGWSAAP